MKDICFTIQDIKYPKPTEKEKQAWKKVRLIERYSKINQTKER